MAGNNLICTPLTKGPERSGNARADRILEVDDDLDCPG